jgi:hypothetical protein
VTAADSGRSALVFRPAASTELDLVLSLPGKPASDVAADWSSGQRRPEWCWLAFAGGRHRPIARALWQGPPSARFPTLLDTITVDIPDRGERRAVGGALISAALPALTPPGGTRPRCLLVLPTSWRARPDARAAAEDQLAMAGSAGLEPAGERLGFIRPAWPAGPLIPRPAGRLEFRPAADTAHQEVLLQTVTQALSDTRETCTRHRIRQAGPAQAASEQIAETRALGAPASWWRLAYDKANDPVGFVLPSRTREGLGIVALLGVIPGHRGHGYVDDLLAECARILIAAGANRIRADADTANTPMIEAFHRAAYHPAYTRLDLL